MTEWSVVVVIIALVGLGATIVRPIVSLTRSITTLTVAVDGLKADLRAYRDKNSESHERLWRHQERQDRRLDEQEKNILRLKGM